MLRDTLSTDEDYKLRLFKNDFTPSQSTTLTDFTEATFDDYTFRTLTRSGWTAAATVSNKAQTAFAQQSWTSGVTGNTIFGYYVEGATSTVVLWAERFGTSRTLAENDVLNLTPKFTLNSEN